MRIEKRTDIPAKNEGVCRMERLVRVDRFSRVVEDGLELGAKQRIGYFDFWLYCIKKHEFFGRLFSTLTKIQWNLPQLLSVSEVLERIPMTSPVLKKDHGYTLSPEYV